MTQIEDIAQAALASTDFRRVVATGEHLQVVLMTVQPGDEIGEEVHEGIDQALVFVAGSGEADLDGQTSPVRPGSLVLVRSGTRHNFRNTGGEPLVLYTLYGPPEHPDGTVHRTKADADEAEAHHHAGAH